MQTQTKTFCLFEGRHELPTNQGAICTGFNFATFTAEKSPLWEEALRSEDCEIYVTGLTPALTQFVAEWAKANINTIEDSYGGEAYSTVDFVSNRLVLLHFNSEKKEYVRQVVFGSIVSNDEYAEMLQESSKEDFYRS